MTNAGTAITCRPVTSVSAATIEHLYLNQILPLAQNAAGALSFHGSAVAIEDFAIAFLGPSGRAEFQELILEFGLGAVRNEGEREVAQTGKAPDGLDLILEVQRKQAREPLAMNA